MALHAIITAAWRLMRISQNSSAFCDVRCVIARATRIENCRSRREAFAGRRCVSVTDQMQFFADAPLSPNMRTQMENTLRRRSAKRDLLNNSQ
jgi:hypothetical protein